jgi:hypothetical protein
LSGLKGMARHNTSSYDLTGQFIPLGVKVYTLTALVLLDFTTAQVNEMFVESDLST